MQTWMIYLLKIIYSENVLYLWVILTWLIPLLKIALKYEWARHIFFFYNQFYSLILYNSLLWINFKKNKLSTSKSLQPLSPPLKIMYSVLLRQKGHTFKNISLYIIASSTGKACTKRTFEPTAHWSYWICWRHLIGQAVPCLNRTSSSLWIWFPILRSHENQQGKNT